MTTELVSVVIPCYNSSPFIEDSLDSALKQREAGVVDVEVIVVDDGSTDDSPTKVEAASLANPGAIRLLRQPRNLGPAAARNVGLRHARGRFVCFLDADDQYAPGFFIRAVEHFRQRPQLAAIVTDIELVNCHREVDAAQRRMMIQSYPQTSSSNALSPSWWEGFRKTRLIVARRPAKTARFVASWQICSTLCSMRQNSSGT